MSRFLDYITETMFRIFVFYLVSVPIASVMIVLAIEFLVDYFYERL